MLMSSSLYLGIPTTSEALSTSFDMWVVWCVDGREPGDEVAFRGTVLKKEKEDDAVRQVPWWSVDLRLVRLALRLHPASGHIEQALCWPPEQMSACARLKMRE